MDNRIAAAGVFVLVFTGTVGVRTFASRTQAGQLPAGARPTDPPQAVAFQRNPSTEPASSAVAGAGRNRRFLATQPGDMATAEDGSNNGEPEPAPEVPVMINVEQSQESGRFNAIIRNRSAGALDVIVTSVNPATGGRSQVQLSVPPRSPINLSDAGLVVGKGAQLLVESPPFLSQTTTVY